MKRKWFLVLIVWLMAPAFADDPPEAKAKEYRIENWLMLGPGQVTALDRLAYDSDRDIADHPFLDIPNLRPELGRKITWSHDEVLEWKPVGRFVAAGEADSLFYFVTFLDARKFMKTRLVIRGLEDALANVYVNGREVKKEFDRKTATLSVDLTLLNATHTLLLKVFVPRGKAFALDAGFTDPAAVETGTLSFSDSPLRRVDFADILNLKRVSGMSLSPDGTVVALSMDRTDESGDTCSWSELLSTADGSTLTSTEGLGKWSDLSWFRDSKGFLYSESDKKTTSLYRYDLLSRKRSKVKSGIKDLAGFELSPDNRFIIYWTYKKKEYGDGFKYIETIPDRSASGTYTHSLYICYLNGGSDRKIRSFSDSLYSVMIGPDNRRVLLSTSTPVTDERPYFRSTFHLLNLEDHTLTTLFDSHLVSPAGWSPDASSLLFTGGPSSFDGIGRMLPEGVVPNEYDTQVFVYDIGSGQARAVTREFEPSVDDVFWSRWDGNLYLQATDRSFIKLFRRDMRRGEFTEIETPVDTVNRIAFADGGRYAVIWGSGVTTPHKLYRVDLIRRRVSLLKDFNGGNFESVRFGRVENWDYTTPEGIKIVGRIHFPPGFSPEKKYPCIVYYYGGTSPVERSFGGRYPFNWYAANGYVVYVLQPSGSVGFGQAFSAVHVNDWGKTTAAEVIAATKELLRTHGFIDPQRLGAMGASYGGFLTQYLATQTDMFAAFISHAGISALSSYWGVGDWGYTYSGVATTGSFPWNRRDIYVDRSPLFLADRITTPLLLLHGDRDNNVPPGESYQMFAALKLLGKEVALVTIKDQSHWILKYDRRVHWMKTIMAWFDRWLKNEPLYWDTLYGKYGSETGKKD